MLKIDNFIKTINTKSSWSAKELVTKLNSLKESITSELKEEGRVDVYRATRTIPVDTIKRYDILYLPVIGITHYFLVYKINHESIIGVIFTTKDKTHSIHKIQNDRFFEDAYATNTFTTIDIAEGYKHFVRVFEDKKEADVIFNKVINYYKNLFNPHIRSFKTTITKKVEKININEIENLVVATETKEPEQVVVAPVENEKNE